MENLKIKVNSEAESKEAQELFFELGAKKILPDSVCYSSDVKAVCLIGDCVLVNTISFESCCDSLKEITLPELRALASLHKNPINMDKVLSEVRSDTLGLLKDKEYLNKETYEFVRSSSELNDMWIEIPEGKNIAWLSDTGSIQFTTIEMGYRDCKIVWQRHTDPEELPFIDDECYTNKSNGGFKLPKDKPCDISKWSELRGESLNDQYAEIEQVRQEYKSNHTGSDLPDFLFEDTVNHPSHYASGEIECIDAMEAMLTPEQFIGYLRGNAFKYQWRYENKGGITDLEKAQWYLNKLISRIG